MRFKGLPLSTVMGLLVIAGAAAVVYGVYLLAGLPEALIFGGIGAVAAGLLVDIG